MKFSKSLFVIAIAALALGACAKTDSEFAQKYAKNGAGYDAVDAQAAATADQEALAKGVSIDIIDMKKTDSGAEKLITSTVMINNNQVPVTTRHSTLQKSSGSVQMSGLTVVYSAVCANANCNPVYVSVEAFKPDNTKVPVVQVGVRKYFDLVKLDRYSKLEGDRALHLISGTSYTPADLYNGNVLVGYLSGNSSTGGYVPNK